MLFAQLKEGRRTSIYNQTAKPDTAQEARSFLCLRREGKSGFSVSSADPKNTIQQAAG